jgi:hypothetical protein
MPDALSGSFRRSVASFAGFELFGNLRCRLIDRGFGVHDAPRREIVPGVTKVFV